MDINEELSPAPAEEPRTGPSADRVLSGETGGGSGAYRFGPGSFVTSGGSGRVYTYTRSGADPAQNRPAEPARPTEPVRPAPAASVPRPAEPIRPAQFSSRPAAPAGNPTGAYQAWNYPNWGTSTNAPGGYGAAPNPTGPYRTAPGVSPESVWEPAPRETARPATEGREIRRSRWWIPLVVIGALMLGLAAGILAQRLRRGDAETPTAPSAPGATDPAASAPPVPTDSDPLSGRIEHGDQSVDYTTPAEIYRQNVNSVVGISNEGTTTNVWGQVTAVASSGTGFILSEDGYILTNYHVAKDADKLTVSLYDGRRFQATLVGYESDTCDVALLKIDAQGLTPVKIGDSDALQVGDPVCTIGNPLGELTYTLTVGYVSAKERAVNSDGTPISMLQTDAAINNGNSGGPLFDFSGNVVAIVTAKYSGTTSSGATVEGLGFAIPINAVMNMIDDLKLHGRAQNQAYLGVRVGDASQVGDDSLPNGAYITSVESGHCAAKAGLRAGDVVIGIDDRSILSYTDLLAEVQSHVAGQTVEMKVWRDGETLTLAVTFDARPKDN